MFSQKLSDDFFSDKVREHFSENDASSDGMQIANVFTKTFYVVADKYGVEIPISKEEYQKIESAPAKPYDSYDDVGTYSMWLTVFERTGADREYEFVAQLTHDGDIGIRIKDDKNIGIAWAGKEAVLDTDVFGQYSTGYNKFGSVKSSAPNQNVLFSTFGSDGPQSSYLTLLEASVTVGAYGRTNQINNVIYQYLYTYLTLFPSISSNGSFGFTTGTTTAQHGLVGEYIS